MADEEVGRVKTGAKAAARKRRQSGKSNACDRAISFRVQFVLHFVVPCVCVHGLDVNA